MVHSYNSQREKPKIRDSKKPKRKFKGENGSDPLDIIRSEKPNSGDTQKMNEDIMNLKPIVKEQETPEEKTAELVESIEFKNGKNTLKISLLKIPPRQYRIKVFFNDTTEIRPSSWVGTNSLNAFWSFLKNSLK